MLPTREDAEQLLIWAHECNPGLWANHSRVVARAAETIADKCNLDVHRAYVSGLLHDIGRYEGIRTLHHVYAGYELMKNKGYDQVADVCLSHSFPYQNIGGYFGINDCTDDETEVIIQLLTNTVYNDYDKLIQLCDAIGTAEGVCLIEVRMVNVIRRYGYAEYSVEKIDALFERKAYFESICGCRIYDLFYDEVIDVSFH